MSTKLLCTIAAAVLSLGALAGSASAAPSSTQTAKGDTALAQAGHCYYVVRYYEVDGVIYRQIVTRCYY